MPPAGSNAELKKFGTELHSLLELWWDNGAIGGMNGGLAVNVVPSLQFCTVMACVGWLLSAVSGTVLLWPGAGLSWHQE